MSQPRIQFTNREAVASKPRRTVGLAVVGLGTVGTGTVKVLAEHQREIQRRLGCKLELKTICSLGISQKDVSWFGGRVKASLDWHEVVRDPEIDIVVELVGVLPVARAIAFAAIDAGKHLVTANKQLVAESGVELAEHARAAGVNLGIEACVAGGTPLLHAIREGLSGEQFAGVYGILNGAAAASPKRWPKRSKKAMPSPIPPLTCKGMMRAIRLPSWPCYVSARPCAWKRFLRKGSRPSTRWTLLMPAA
jgi:hypothetical protein